MSGGVDDGTTPPLEPVLITYGLWQSLFDGSESAVGSRIELSGAPNEVVGVLPENFELLLPDGVPMNGDVELWSVIPIDLSQDPREFGRMTVFARVASGSTVADAQQQLANLARSHREQYEYHSTSQVHLDAAPILEESVRETRPVVLMMLSAVGLLLLVATANVSNLMLVRGKTRATEFNVKSALGASRASLVVQFMAEGFLLALCALGVGVAAATVGIDLIVGLNQGALPRLENAGLDLGVLAFSGLIAIAAAVLSSSIPALFGTRVDLASGLRGRGVSVVTGKGRTMSSFVVVQTTLSMMLLVGATLLARSTMKLSAIDLGYTTTSLASFDVNPPFWRYRNIDDRLRFIERTVAAISEVPGIGVATGALPLPLVTAQSPMGNATGPYSATGDAEEWNRNSANYRSVLPGYFDALEMTVIRGRGFESLDNAEGASPTVVVDERLAAAVWPNRDPVGEQLMVSLVPTNSATDDDEQLWAEVIGVVGNSRLSGLKGSELPTLYFPARFLVAHDIFFHHLNSWPSCHLPRSSTRGSGIGRRRRGRIRIDGNWIRTSPPSWLPIDSLSRS